MLAVFFGLGGLEIVIVLAVLLLLFGNRLPGLARSMGSSIVEFKKGIREIDETSGKSGPNESVTHEHKV